MGMDVHGNSGDTFRATIWAWPAILSFIQDAGYDVPSGWHYNSGEGLQSQEECIALAGILESYLHRWNGSRIEVPSNTLFVDQNGHLVTEKCPGAETPFWTDREHIVEWIKFLKNCEGFEIW